MRTITTVYDMRLAKYQADAIAEYRSELKEVKAKIRKWRAKSAKFSGDVHAETLARFEARYFALTGKNF